MYRKATWTTVWIPILFSLSFAGCVKEETDSSRTGSVGRMPQPAVNPIQTSSTGAVAVAFATPAANSRTEGVSFSFSVTCDRQGGTVTVTPVAGQSSPAALGCPNGTVSFSLAFTGNPGSRTVSVRQVNRDGLSTQSSRAFNFSPCPKKQLLGSYAVDASYAASDAGEYCLIPNRRTVGNVTRYNFASNSEMTDPRILADPQVKKIGSWYYLTGTSEPTSNIHIWRSSDLVNWNFHMYAFPADQDGDDGLLTLYNRPGFPGGRRSFRHIWDAHLDYDPANPGVVRLYFTTTECRAGMYCNGNGLPAPYNAEDYSHFFQGIQFVTIPTSDLENATSTFAAAPSRAHEPSWLGYDDGAGNLRLDGGRAVSAPLAARFIPSFVSPELFVAPHYAQRSYLRMGHNRNDVGAGHIDQTAAALGPSVFRDPAPGGLTWMLYNWVSWGSTPASDILRGNHTAMHPMRGAFFDGQSPHPEPYPVAYHKNTNLVVEGSNVPEGRMTIGGAAWGQGAAVAEGGAMFYNRNNGKYYSVYSRNTADSAAYAMFYKKGDTAIGATLGAYNWTQASDTQERLLLAGTNRLAADGIYYGGGEVFETQVGNTYQYYAVFHALFSTASCTNRFCRTMFIKELSFAANGDILPMRDRDSDGMARDLRWFRVPR
ncbi:MAG: hypothetical protein AB7P04_15105 [Bacteriovoracia bacterium]